MSNITAEIEQHIKSALDEDDLDLPSLPEVALEIQDVADSDTVSAQSLSLVIGKDAGLAAQLVRIANSPMFRATRSIDDLSQAISRLGVDYSANIVTGLAMRQMFQATSEMVDNKLRQVWKMSTEVASWSALLCKKYTQLRPDQATLAGLTHCIGVLPILGWVEEHDNMIRDSMTLDRVIDSLHPTIGTMILKHWNFAEEIVSVPEHYASLNHQADKADYIDVVSVAHLLALHDTDHPILESNWQSSPAFTRLGLNPDWEQDEMTELLSEVQEVQSVFQ
ncbi:MAG: HDOD domain-containing protein [Pseudomonadales bacterium]